MSLSKLIRAPPSSISNLYTIITSQPSSFPVSLSLLVQEMASRDDASITTAALKNEEYNRMMKEIVKYGNEMLKLVSDRAEKMGSEEVYDADVLELCT